MNGGQDWLIVGKIVAAQGLDGKVRVNPNSDFPERFTKPGARWLQTSSEEPKKINLLSGKQLPGKSIYVVALEGVQDRSTAKLLVGKKLLVPSSNRPQLKANEFHFLDLVGLEVKLNQEDPPIGKISNLINAGNDLLEVETVQGKKILIPFVKSIVPELKIEEGWVKITPPQGLLELENLD